MEDDYGSNVHAGLEKKCPLYGVLALECPLWRGFVITDSLGIRPGQNFLSVVFDHQRKNLRLKLQNLKFRLETHIVLENTSTSAKGFVECDTGIKTSGSFKCIKYRKIEYDITFCHHGVCFIF